MQCLWKCHPLGGRFSKPYQNTPEKSGAHSYKRNPTKKTWRLLVNILGCKSVERLKDQKIVHSDRQVQVSQAKFMCVTCVREIVKTELAL